MKKKKILITVGGTGGHVFPAIALAEQLQATDPSCEILFVGGLLGSNRFFERDRFDYHEVSCGSISLKKPIKALGSLARIAFGIQQSKKIIKEFSPHIIVGFGSYHTLPTLVGAKLCKIPIVLHEANRIPGRVNRLLSRFVTLTGTLFEDTCQQLKGAATEVPLPLRKQYKKDLHSHNYVREYLQIQSNKKTLLIFGGSQGAQAINRLTAEALTLLPKAIKNEIQILHYTGDEQVSDQIKSLYKEHGITAVVKNFESRMDLAWQAADFFISRSGAGTIAEAIEFEVPGIYIPYYYAADNHQESNADYMVSNIKCGLKLPEKKTTAQEIANVISKLLTDSGQLKEMQQNISLFKNKKTRPDLCSIILQMVEKDV